MPWRAGKKTSKGWQILKEKGNKQWVVVGYSDSKDKAEASVRARYAAEGGHIK